MALGVFAGLSRKVGVVPPSADGYVLCLHCSNMRVCTKNLRTNIYTKPQHTESKGCSSISDLDGVDPTLGSAKGSINGYMISQAISTTYSTSQLSIANSIDTISLCDYLVESAGPRTLDGKCRAAAMGVTREVNVAHSVIEHTSRLESERDINVFEACIQ